MKLLVSDLDGACTYRQFPCHVFIDLCRHLRERHVNASASIRGKESRFGQIRIVTLLKRLLCRNGYR